MPPEKTPETSEDILKQIQEADVETSEEEETEGLLFKAAEDEEAEETEELEGKETSEEEETEGAEEKEEKPETFPIIVDGVTEYVTKEKLIEYAQKGRFLERERAKDKGEKPPKIEFDPQKADKEFLDNVKRKGFVAAMGELFLQGSQALKAQDVERRKEARSIADSSEWGKDASYRTQFNALIDDGMEPENAGLKISSQYWQEQARKGEERGAEKVDRKEAVKMVKGKENAPDTRKVEGEASLMKQYEEALSEGKPTSELLKIMKKAGVQIGKDTV